MATNLRDEIIRKIKRTEDVYCFYSTTMPILEAAIRGEITQSLDLDKTKFINGNYRHDKTEGILPPEYDQDFKAAAADFRITAEALSLEKWDKVIVDGVTYGWVNLEEEGDWPDNVKYP